MKILTVSIAAYNVAAFLRQTLDSCIVPEIMDDLEVFIVNDGSTDETPEIAREYERKYPNTFRLLDKENGGYGSTVNLSIKEATGKYFKLLDGDDWFDKDGLKELILMMRKTDADVFITGMCRSTGEGPVDIMPRNFKKTGEALPVKDMALDSLYSMWEIAYKTDIVRRSKLKMPERVLYTDMFYATIPFSCAKTVCYMSPVVYCYRVGRDGQSVSRESRIKHCDEAIFVNKKLIEFYETDENAKQCDAHRYIEKRIAQYLHGAYRTIMLDKVTRKNCQKARELERFVKTTSKTIYSVSCTFAGGVIGLMRKTNFLAYYLIVFVPGGLPNWT